MTGTPCSPAAVHSTNASSVAVWKSFAVWHCDFGMRRAERSSRTSDISWLRTVGIEWTVQQ
eukprot:scaffold256046_cov17-Prasinocladus_malaysianus.AAC.2